MKKKNEEMTFLELIFMICLCSLFAMMLVEAVFGEDNGGRGITPYQIQDKNYQDFK